MGFPIPKKLSDIDLELEDAIAYRVLESEKMSYEDKMLKIAIVSQRYQLEIIRLLRMQAGIDPITGKTSS